jgi:hypothetical protein
MRRDILLALAAAGLVLAGPVAAAAQETEGKPDKSFTFTPKLLDSDETGSATLAVEYRLDRDLFKRTLDSDDSGLSDYDIEAARVGDIALSAKGQGTIAASAERNPENFLDMRLSLDATYSANTRFNAKVGLYAKYEADQSFESDNAVFGGHATWVGYDILVPNAWLGLDGAYGQVDPGDDAARKTALGVTDLDSYNRVEFEAVYRMPLSWVVIDSLEFNYRFYKEIDAPAPIKAADLEVHQLGGVRVGLRGDLFVGYRVGKLPFDRKDDHTLEVGFSYKLF